MPKMMCEMGKCMKAQHGGMMHRMKGYAHTVLMHAEALKLSDEQLGKIMRIEMRHQKAHQDLMERLHKSMMSAREGLMDSSAEEAGIRKASKEHAEAFIRIAARSLDSSGEFLAQTLPAIDTNRPARRAGEDDVTSAEDLVKFDGVLHFLAGRE